MHAAHVGFQLLWRTWPSCCFHLLGPAHYLPLHLTRRYQLGVGVSRFMSQVTDLLCTRAERVGWGRRQATRMQRADWPSGQTSRPADCHSGCNAALWPVSASLYERLQHSAACVTDRADNRRESVLDQYNWDSRITCA